MKDKIQTKSFVIDKEYATIGDAVNAGHEIKTAIKQLEDEYARIQALVRADMAGATSKIYKVGKATWTVTDTPVSSTRVDTKALKAKYPEIAKECSTTSTSPRFTIK